MNSHWRNINGICSKLLFAKQAEVIDLTSDCEIYELDTDKSEIKPSLKLPKLTEIIRDSNSLNSKENHLEKRNNSLINFSEIMNIEIEI